MTESEFDPFDPPEAVRKAANEADRWLVKGLDETRFINGTLLGFAGASLAYIIEQGMDPLLTWHARILLLAGAMMIGSMVAGLVLAMYRNRFVNHMTDVGRAHVSVLVERDFNKAFSDELRALADSMRPVC